MDNKQLEKIINTLKKKRETAAEAYDHYVHRGKPELCRYHEGRMDAYTHALELVETLSKPSKD